MLFKRYKTIKGKLLLSFGVIFFVTCGVIGMNWWFSAKEERLGKITFTLTELDRNVQILSKLEKDFFSDETINPDFYQTGSSAYLTQRQQTLDNIYQSLKLLQEGFPEIYDFKVVGEIRAIEQNIKEYVSAFSKLETLIRLRGFKDYGLEGKMRASIHALEQSGWELDKALLLSIRRHEKDFIIRKDEEYVDKNAKAIAALEQYVRQEINNQKAQDSLLSLIDQYRKYFLTLANVEKEIGFDNESGLKLSLRQASDNITNQINLLNQSIFFQTSIIYDNIKIAFVFVIGLYIAIYFIFAFFITQALSVPISTLSESIDRVIESNFSREVLLAHINTQDEVGGLADDFQYMLIKVQDSIDEIKIKSEKIEEKQKMLFKSLEYAKHIQQAILPDEGDLKAIFAEHCVIYLPRDVVSGDFYWIVRRYQKLFVAMVDCTGHGVPGAFMSLIGHTLLTKIVTQDKLSDPAQILESLHLEIKDALRQASKKNDDGMDIALCLIERKEESPQQRQITFAGAHSSMFYTDKGELKELKGMKRSIGGNYKYELKPFENQSIALEDSEVIYFFTDGWADQHNAAGEKYSKKNLKAFIAQIKELPLAEQYGRLMIELHNFMGGQPQRDDISMLAFRI